MTTRLLPDFEYIEPETIEEAISFLTQCGDKASILAGGTDLLPLMKRRIEKVQFIVNIKTISGLDYIKYDNDERMLKIGALTTIRKIEKSSIIQDRFPLLREASQNFGTVQIRNMATLGGNLCNASPAADMGPPLLVLGSQVKIVGSKGEKTIPLEQFFIGPRKNILKKNEILTEVQVKEPKPRTGTAFLKIGRVKSDIAKLNAAFKLTLQEHDICNDVGIALGSVAPTPIRAKEAERKLIGNKICDEIINEVAELVVKEIDPISDIRSTAEYRREVSKVLVRRGLIRCYWRVR
jgi:carbon-monoxide dehydrogenase medium subunit